MLEWIRFILSASLILFGLFILVSAIIGVYRFKYVLNRMHAAAMGDTLGLLFVILGLIVASGFNFTSLKLLLLIAMLWISSPVSSHLIGRLEVATNPDLEEKMTLVTENDPHKEVE
ncbi:MAG: monovalent cation/H(+) antiporter subunit G [Clostridia bacterium]|nr:monovalent cation/H(+) antiporter subunit G [Clostridia bacterium]